MSTLTKTGVISLALVAVLATLTGCGPSQEEKDKTAATEVATQFVGASYKDKCLYDADYPTQKEIDQCLDERAKSTLPETEMPPFTVQAVEPWSNGIAVKLTGEGLQGVYVVGLVKVGSDWKVSKEDTASEAVGAQSDWACQVIGGPDCGGSK